MFKKVLLIAAMGVLAGFASGSAAIKPNPNPGVVPIHARAFGTTYADLALAWTKWGLETPAAVNPILDETGEFGAVGQSGKVWFLAGNFGGETTRAITVPTGKALFFPILAYQGWAPTDGATEAEVRDTCAFFMDMVYELECTIDGRPLQELFSYREDSPAGVLGPNDMTDMPDGSDILLAEGYWLLLTPMSKGLHEVHFNGALGPPGETWFDLDVTYFITVAKD